MKRVICLSRTDAAHLLLEASTPVCRRQNDYLKAPFYLCGAVCKTQTNLSPGHQRCYHSSSKIQFQPAELLPNPAAIT